MHLVDPIARQIAAKLPPSFDIDDLIQTGRLGLLDAAVKYKPRAHNNTPFDAYARIRIRGEMIASIRRRHYTEATCLGLEQAPESAVDPAVEKWLDKVRRARAVHTSLEDLPPRHRRVIELHYCQDQRLSAVSREIGVCPSRASQLHLEALKRLQKSVPLRLVDKDAA